MPGKNLPLPYISVVALMACVSMTARATNLNFPPPAGVENLRTHELFDAGWRFQRYGLQSDGKRVAEPGALNWEVAVTASTEEAEKGNPAVNAFDGDLTNPLVCQRAGPQPVAPTRPAPHRRGFRRKSDVGEGR